MVGKEIYSEGEWVRIQDIKSKLWNLEGIVKWVRTADDWTILSYDIDIDGTVTSDMEKRVILWSKIAEIFLDCGWFVEVKWYFI